MAEFHTLPTGKNRDAIELCEEVLARLKSGEAVAVALVEVRRGGVVATAVSKSDVYHQLNSGAARLASSLATSTD